MALVGLASGATGTNMPGTSLRYLRSLLHSGVGVLVREVDFAFP